jgi:hypothetical protein
MRTMGFLATYAMAWAVSLGALASAPAPHGTPAVGEITQCLIPMLDAVPPLGSCSDRPPSLSEPEPQPDPQWAARRAP